MAIYHFSTQIISRGKGRSAVAAAAYRAGETITNQWDGITHDYANKGWIKHKEILLPEHAPTYFKNRSALWNAVEEAEKSSDSQLTREFVIALPIELNLDQQVELARNYIQNNFINRGMCVDFVIHNPPLTDGENRPIDIDGNPTNNYGKMIFQNPHAHVMTTMRPLDAEGRWEAKTQKQYMCKRRNEEISVPASLIKQAEDEGFFKQYRFEIEGKKRWLTLQEGEEIGLKPLNYDPKSRAIPNPAIADWNKRETLLSWRESWAEYCNEALKRNDFEIKIDARSYEEQGINHIPAIHLGAQAFNMEKKGMATELGDLNRQIKADNAFLQRMQQRFDRMEEEANEHSKQVAAKLEAIRAQHIIVTYQELTLAQELGKYQSELDNQLQLITALEKNVEHVTAVIESLSRSLEVYEKEKQRTNPLHIKKRKELEEKVLSTESRIQEVKKNLAELQAQYKKEQQKYNDVSLVTKTDAWRYKQERKEELKQKRSELYREFYSLIKNSAEDMHLIRELVQGKRKHYDVEIEERLREYYRETFNKNTFDKALTKAPELMFSDGANLTRDFVYRHKKRI